MIMKNKVLTFVCCSFLFSAYLNAQEPLTTDQEKQLDKIGAMVKSDPAAASKELSELLKQIRFSKLSGIIIFTKAMEDQH